MALMYMCVRCISVSTLLECLGGSMSYIVGLPNNSYKPITNTAWVRARLCKYKKGCSGLAAASGKVYQLLAHSRWFSPGTPASSTIKTGSHDIAEILLKVALSTKSFNQSIHSVSSIYRLDAVTVPTVLYFFFHFFKYNVSLCMQS